MFIMPTFAFSVCCDSWSRLLHVGFVFYAVCLFCDEHWVSADVPNSPPFSLSHNQVALQDLFRVATFKGWFCWFGLEQETYCTYKLQQFKVLIAFLYLGCVQGPQGEPGPPGQQGLPGPHVSFFGFLSVCFFFSASGLSVFFVISILYHELTTWWGKASYHCPKFITIDFFLVSQKMNPLCPPQIKQCTNDCTLCHSQLSFLILNSCSCWCQE